MKRIQALLALTTAMALLVPADGATGINDATRGAKIYDARCSSCHSIDENLVGPRHRGVYGRKAGSLTDFQYSNALRHATVTWDDETLDHWLAGPRSFIPGSRMCVRVSSSDDRHALIEYLKSDAVR